ncbi:hypothetical protein [Frigoribacterium sp. UYMn621]|uniref:hypothetical protein n=1 Tax=Frigoribacterium sp. UYMn621 TaxID=3156343 RepID=UPI00339A760C
MPRQSGYCCAQLSFKSNALNGTDIRIVHRVAPRFAYRNEGDELALPAGGGHGGAGRSDGRIDVRPANRSPGSSNAPFPFTLPGNTLDRMDEPAAERPLKVVSEDDSPIEPNLDWDAAGINASGGLDPRSGLPTVLHEVRAEE